MNEKKTPIDQLQSPWQQLKLTKHITVLLGSIVNLEASTSNQQKIVYSTSPKIMYFYSILINEQTIAHNEHRLCLMYWIISVNFVWITKIFSFKDRSFFWGERGELWLCAFLLVFLKTYTENFLDCAPGGFMYFFAELWKAVVAMTYQYQIMQPYLLPMQKYSLNYSECYCLV